jgi:hypothetical protein
MPRIDLPHMFLAADAIMITIDNGSYSHNFCGMDAYRSEQLSPAS